MSRISLYRRFGKRGFDLVASLAGLLILAPLFVVLFIAVKWSSKGPAFFKQERIGQNFKPFTLYKFRSMVVDAPQLGPNITSQDDPRITRVGRFLRNTKLDELPQLINVIKGDLSLVGPRPEVRRYVEIARSEYEKILSVKPGITDFAAIKFRNEEALLAQFEDKDQGYIDEVLPQKIVYYHDYITSISFKTDLNIIFLTLAAIFRQI